MVNPGSFTGSRKIFLQSQKEYYADAVNNGFCPEAISLIQRRYFNRYPIDLPHDEEPTEDHLAVVDDEAAIQEPEEPNPEAMTAEEYASALDRLEERQKLVYFRKAQIKRWFSYQYMKDLDLDASQTGIVNPYRLLIAQLTGKKINCPRQRSACNTWRKTARDNIEEKVKVLVKTAKDLGEKPEPLIALRDRVAREMFKDLDEDEQERWSEVATKEHKVAIKEWKKQLEGKPATDAKSRQVAIQGLVKFIQPILDQICEATGWKASFIAGGPEPADAGLLNIVSVHSGTTTGDVKMNFGRAERERFRKVIVPTYGGFLQKCYTPEECCSRALGPEQGFLPLSQLDLDNEGASTDTILQTSSTGATILAAPSSSTPSSGEEPSGSIPAGNPSTKNIEARGDDSSPNEERVGGGNNEQERVEGVGARNMEEEVETEHNPFPFDIPAESPIPSPCPSPQPEDVSPAVATPADFTDPAVTTASPPVSTTANSSAGDVSANSPAVATATKSPPVSTMANSSSVNDSSDSPAVATPTNVSPLTAATHSISVAAAIPVPTEFNTNASGSTSPVDENTSVTTGTRGVRRSRRAANVEKGVEDGSRVGKRGAKRSLDADADAAVTGKVPAVKKTRISEGEPVDTPSLGDFTMPDDAPLWFKNAFKMVFSDELGEGWRMLLERWGRFEIQACNLTKPNLPTKNRPKAIGDWIQRARSTTWRPDLKNPDLYGGAMMLWWRGMQPEWRVLENGKLLRVLGGDLEVLRRPGVNGLLSIVVGLFFWGRNLTKGSEKGDWLDLVIDLDFVLAELCKNP